MRTTAEEMARIGRFIAEKSTACRAPCASSFPRAACRASTRQASLSGIPRRTERFLSAIVELPIGFESLVRLPHHTTTRRSPTPWSPASTRSPKPHGPHPRQDILKKLHAQARRGDLIGGGAGRLSAKCEEAGGIDLIVIYNSGRYRMAGRGSLAGLMAYGNANDIVLDMAREVLPVVKPRRCSPALMGRTRSLSKIHF